MQVNELFENTFDSSLNPLNKFYEVITQIAGKDYVVKRMEMEGVKCPQGVFRFLTKELTHFPYHTDGFNYGQHINGQNNRNHYEVMSDKYYTNSIIGVILKLQDSNCLQEASLYNCLVDDIEMYANELGMYSHWMGTKYNNIQLLEKLLTDKPFYSPLLNCGSLYFFSASRIHKVESIINSKNRIVLATFLAVDHKNITIYQ